MLFSDKIGTLNSNRCESKRKYPFEKKSYRYMLIFSIFVCFNITDRIIERTIYLKKIDLCI